MNSQKQLATAMMTYESSRKSFPGYANWIGGNNATFNGGNGGIPGSWVVALLPNLEKVDMYNLWAGYNGGTNTFATNLTVNSVPNNPYMKLLICPSDAPDNTNDAWCSYVCNRGCNGWNYPYLGVCMDQATPAPTAAHNIPPVSVSLDYINSHDGSSTTLLLAESLLDYPTNPPQPFIPRQEASQASVNTAKWTTPPTISSNSSPAQQLLKPAATNDMEAAVGFEWSQWSSASPSISDKLLSRHPGGVNVSYCDGHQQFLASNIDVPTFMMLMTPYDNGIPGRTQSGGTITGTGTMTGTPPWNDTATPQSNATIPSVPPLNYLLDESKYQ
jgi:prepilin-type processing-associated H-X9-DG protein